MKRIVSLCLCAALLVSALAACGEKTTQEEQAAIDLVTAVVSGDLTSLKNCEGYKSMPEDLDIFESVITEKRADTEVKVLETTENKDGSFAVVLGADSPDLNKAYDDITMKWLDKAISDDSLTEDAIETGILEDLGKDKTVANWRVEITVTPDGEGYKLNVEKCMDSLVAVYTCNLSSKLKAAL